MKIATPKRRRKATRRLDVTDMKAALADGRVWCQLAVVRKPTDVASHFTVSPNGRDILVEVETVPHGQDLTCRLGTFAGGAGMGLWRIPSVGDEVLVAVPDAEMAFQPTIVAVLSCGSVPERARLTNRTVLAAVDVIEHVAPSVCIGAQPAATEGMALGTATMTWANAHVHGTPFGPTSPPSVPMQSGVHVSTKHKIEPG